MKRLVLSVLLLLPFLMTIASPAAAQGGIEPWPEATAEMAGVGEAGPRFDTGGHILSTSEFIAKVVQDASVTWTAAFEAAGRPFVPPTVVIIEAGSYARSSCGINVGDPAEDDHLTPMLDTVGAETFAFLENYRPLPLLPPIPAESGLPCVAARAAPA